MADRCFTGVMKLCMVLLPIALITGCTSPASPDPDTRHLLILVDGLRPDYVTAEVMPNLTALGKRGVVYTRHHSVFPTVTRVNASSISTGAYPESHGLLGNSVFFPSVDPARFLDTSNRDNLLKVEKAAGRLLTATTLGETLQRAGQRMLVTSSGSSGSAYLNNHTISGGAILHYQFVVPESLADAMRSIGPATADAGSPAALDRAAVDAFLKVGIPRVNPSVTVIWLGALDSTAHANGIGAPATIEILQQVDREIGRVQQGLSAAGLLDRYNIWVTSDHGFSTHTGGVDLDPILKPFAGTLPDQSPRIVSGGGAIYVRDGDQAAIAQIAGLLQKTPGVGAIFTRSAQPGILDGSVPGTLSFDAARWTHERAAQILFSPDWTDAPNAYGMRGTVASGGVAGHGSSSIWDIHNTLIAAGPNLRQGVTLDVPSANVDFAPTFLKLLEIPIPASMQGRSLEEALAGGTTSGSPAVRTIEHTAVTPDRSYSVTATFSIVSAGGKDYRYLDLTKVVRQ